MKIRYFFSLAFLFITLTVIAQFDNHRSEWYPGVIILESEEIVKGELSYDHASDLIMCRADDRIKTFGPHQAESFQYYDEKTNVLHKYEVFSIRQNSYYNRKSFFEVVIDGDINYIRKRNRYPVYQPRDGYLVERGMNAHEVAFDYYVEVDGELIKSRRFNKEVLPQLMLNEQSLESFMKEKRLRTYDIADQIVLLNYYNRQAEKTKATANHTEETKTAKSGSD